MEDALDAKQQSFTGNSLDDPGTQRLDLKQKAALFDDETAAVDSKNEFGDAVVSASNTTATADVTKAKAEPVPAGTGSESDSNEDSIEIIAEKGSWVEVRDANKSRLLYNMLPVGGSRELTGRAPFSVTMGNARTTRVLVNDVEIDVSDYISSKNTANFKVSTQGQEIIFH